MKRFASILALSTAVLIPAVSFAQRSSDACKQRNECGVGLACVAGNCLADGKLRVTLSWPASTDLDLFLVSPTGDQISAALDSRITADGGELTRDECYNESDCEDDSGHLNVEHIVWTWASPIPDGEFEVWALNFDGRAATELTITVTKPDGSMETFTGGIAGAEGEQSEHFRFTVKDTICELDTDRDGLCDKWEIEGVDIDGDGTIDLDLPALGANPNHKDLFVEVDRLQDQKVFGLGGVVDAFARAPADNPDSKPGITLHIEMGDEIDRYGSTDVTSTTVFNHRDIAVVKYGTSTETEDSHACEGGWFGTAADRASENCVNIMKARKYVYRYALYISRLTIGGYSGYGELAGNDFIVSVGSWGSQNTQAVQQGTFMHEIGHTLRLGHGGGDHRHCKPNHLSVMNYLYQLPGSYAGRPLTFGPQLPMLDEASLEESVGIQGPASWAQVVFAALGKLNVTKSDAASPVDWNQDMDTEDSLSMTVSSGAVRADGSLPCGEAQAPQALETIDEWAALRLNFRTTGGWNAVFPGADFGAGDDAESSELDHDDYKEMASASDSDGDGLSNLDDNCPTDVNPEQDDADEDGVGDLCDLCPDVPAVGYIDGCPENPDGSSTATTDPDGSEEEESASNTGEGSGSGVEEPDFIEPKQGCATAGGSSPGAAPLLLLFGGAIGRRRRNR